MAADPAATALTEAHRQGQARLGANVVVQMLAASALLDPADLDGTFARWLQVVVPLVSIQRRVSAQLAAGYLAAFRAVELAGAEPIPPLIAGVVDVKALTTSMLVTGPVTVKSALARGVLLDRAVEAAQTRTAAAAMRHVLDGGRQTITDTLEADPAAHGWARATSGKACGFCSMLASRGPAYKGEDTARFEAHDGCVLPRTLVAGPSVEVAYRRWYEGEVVIVSLPGGGELAVTANHPVLTDRGWVEAQFLSETDQVVRRSGVDLASLGVPHEQDVPTPIEDVWGAASVNGLRSVPVATEDFHGDGIGTKGDVDVVASYGLFPDVAYTAGGEEGAEHFGAGARSSSIGDPFSAQGYPLTHLLALSPSPAGCVCGSGVGAVLLRSERTSVQSGAGGHTSPLDPRFPEPPFHDATGDAEPIGQPLLTLASGIGRNEGSVRRFDPPVAGALGPGPGHDASSAQNHAERVRVHADLGRRLLERLAGGVELTRPLDLRRVDYSGHVFNLRTVEGWYDANSLVVSNCSCTAEPVYHGDAAWPAGARRHQEPWRNATAGLGGQDAVNAFRKAVAAP